MIRLGWLSEGEGKAQSSPLPYATMNHPIHQKHAKTAANLTLVGIAYLSLTVSLIALLGLAVVVNKMELILATDVTSTPAKVSPTITGEVLMIAGDICVIRDTNGKGVLLQLSKATKIEGTVEIGDKVEAHESPDGQVLSLRKVR